MLLAAGDRVRHARGDHGAGDGPLRLAGGAHLWGRGLQQAAAGDDGRHVQGEECLHVCHGREVMHVFTGYFFFCSLAFWNM